LYAYRTVEQRATWFLNAGLLQHQQYKQVKTIVYQIIKLIRPNAISIMDAFAIPDHLLNSPLGAYDGDIYNKYFKAVSESRLNELGTAPYWEELVKPRVINQTQSKL